MRNPARATLRWTPNGPHSHRVASQTSSALCWAVPESRKEQVVPYGDSIRSGCFHCGASAACRHMHHPCLGFPVQPPVVYVPVAAADAASADSAEWLGGSSGQDRPFAALPFGMSHFAHHQTMLQGGHAPGHAMQLGSGARAATSSTRGEKKHHDAREQHPPGRGSATCIV